MFFCNHDYRLFEDFLVESRNYNRLFFKSIKICNGLYFVIDSFHDWIQGGAVSRKTCDLAFFRLCQNILLMSILRYQKILLAANTRDIYEQLSLITFFVSGYFGL